MHTPTLPPERIIRHARTVLATLAAAAFLSACANPPPATPPPSLAADAANDVASVPVAVDAGAPDAAAAPMDATTATDACAAQDAGVAQDAGALAGLACLGPIVPLPEGCSCATAWDLQTCITPDPIECDTACFFPRHTAQALELMRGPMPGTITAIVDWQDTWSNGCKCHVPEGKRVYVIDAVTWQVCLIDRHAWVSLPGELLLGVNTAPPPAQDGFWPDLTLFLLPGPGPDVWFWGDETGWWGTSTMVFPTKTALRLFKAYPATSDCQKEPTALHGFLFHNVTDPKTGKQMFATPMVAGAPEIVLPL